MPDKFDLLEKIGEGSYGLVFKAREKATQNIIAVKLIDKSKFERKDRKNFHRECGIHAKLHHPNIIQMLNSFETPGFIVVATELAGIDLHRFLDKVKLSEHHVQKLAWDILSALHYLHSHRISHRDLKPQNILLNNSDDIENMQAKLCDFGLARNMASETYLLTSVKGTPLYMAPEVMDDALYDERADFWSVGCILYEALFGKAPTAGLGFIQLLKWFRKAEILWPDSIPIAIECKTFLQGLLRKNPKSRLTWPEIINHPYVSNNLLILDATKSDHPLTQALTASQQIKKEKQRTEIIFHRGKKMIDEAMNKCQMNEQPTNKNNRKSAKNKRRNVIGDNESISSADSVNAIIQTDLETDVEAPMRRNCLPNETVTEELAAGPSDNQNFVIQRYTENFTPITHDNRGVVNVHESLANDMSNLRIGTMAENLQQEENRNLNTMRVKPSVVINQAIQAERQPFSSIGEQSIKGTDNQRLHAGSRNKELERRKLSQNLENFSIRLGNSGKQNGRGERKITEETTQSSQSVENTEKPEVNLSGSDAKLDLYGDAHSPPIENEEWLAFIYMTMQEVVNGELDSLKDSNLVSTIVAILRNFTTNIKVIETVVQLLSIPFVLGLSSETITRLKAVYVETKLLPNLIFASKIICTIKPQSGSISSTLSSSNFVALHTNPDQAAFRELHELSSDHIKTLRTIYELVCHLMHLGESLFLTQFCDSVYIIAGDLLRHFYANAAILLVSTEGTNLLVVLTAILCFVLRETPENAEIVEQIIFHPTVNIIALLKSENAMLRMRVCCLLRIVGRFSCYALQNAWSSDFQEALEALLDDDERKVREVAKPTIAELRYFSFYEVK